MAKRGRNIGGEGEIGEKCTHKNKNKNKRKERSAYGVVLGRGAVGNAMYFLSGRGGDRKVEGARKMHSKSALCKVIMCLISALVVCRGGGTEAEFDNGWAKVVADRFNSEWHNMHGNTGRRIGAGSD